MNPEDDNYANNLLNYLIDDDNEIRQLSNLAVPTSSSSSSDSVAPVIEKDTEEVCPDDIVEEISIRTEKKENCESRMARLQKYSGIVLIMSCLISIVVNHLVEENTSAKLTRGPRRAEPIISNVSYLDVFDGDMSTVYDEYLRHEMTVTFFYAPWDANSRSNLVMINELAEQMPDVRFIAVNCWQNPGCLKNYEYKFYPALSVYVRGLGSLQYPINAMSKEYIATFLYNIINPVTVITENVDWYAKRSQHFAVVAVPLRNFQFGYTLALEALRKDPHQRVGYAVLFQGGSEIRLHLWNSTLIYDETDNPTVGSVSKWVYSKFVEPITFLSNSGFKSAHLRQVINGTRAFMVVKSAPESRMNLHMHMLALQIYSCGETYSNYTKHVLMSLLFRMRQDPTDCDQVLETVVCTSTVGSCSKFPLNRSFYLNWDTRVEEICIYSELNRLRNSENRRLCLTQQRLYPVSKQIDLNPMLIGAACDMDLRFKIIVLDASLFNKLYPLESPVVIYDNLDESKYLLPASQLSAQGVEIFLGRYFSNSKESLKKSTSIVRRDLFHRRPEKFNPPILSKEDTVVFFYTNWCGFCKSVTAIFFRVAVFFKSAPIVFRSVDAEASRFDDFKYSPDTYPQVVFFPANSSDSIRYHGAWKLQGLTRFILENCNDQVIQGL